MKCKCGHDKDEHLWVLGNGECSHSVNPYDGCTCEKFEST